MRATTTRCTRSAGATGMTLLFTALLALALAAPAGAQTFSTADLEGTWQVFQLGTPRGVLTGDDVRTFRGEVSFDASGAVTGVGVLADNVFGSYVVGGNLSVSAGGVVGGMLVLTATGPDGQSGLLQLREARLLASRFTILGAANVLGQVGLFTLVKRDDTQSFTLADDLGGDWDYHELTPSNTLTAGGTGADAAWVNGSITFHGDTGCTEADLDLSDGTVRSRRSQGSQSFN